MHVYELAKELGMDSRSLLKRCGRIGIFARSASSPLSQEDVAALRGALKTQPKSSSLTTRQPASLGRLQYHPVDRGTRATSLRLLS